MPKAKQSNIKTRVSRRKANDHSTLGDNHHDLKAAFLQNDNDKKQPVRPINTDDSISSTIDKNKKNSENPLSNLTSPRHIEVHQDNMNRVDKLLRAFDLDYKYGPCVGLSRLQRWERANALGLEPPFEIKSFLLDNKDYQECLFKGSVI
ncbi:DNA polymerase delta, subunit 4-domain-containing protein [Chlamydoabsidia padenii]|nr:DNA polymerase delta, subunit 4-domain-containing protein [Chlamydoabsidia padenii]